MAGVIDRRLHRFQTRGDAVQREVGAIADGEDARVARAQVPVHDDAVGDRQPRLGGKLDIGAHARGQQDEVGGNGPAVGQRHALGRGGPGDPGAQRGQPDIDPGLAVEIEKALRHGRRHGAGHQPVGGLDHRDLDAARGGDGRELEPDEAAADHRRAADALGHGAQPRGVGQAPQLVHAGQVEARQRRAQVARAGRQHEAVEGDAPAILQHHLAGGPVDGGHDDARAVIDAGRLEEGRGLQRQPAFVAVLHVGLAQRRALVGQSRLVPDQGDGSREALLPQAGRGLQPPLPRAHDHHPVRHACPSRPA